MAADTVNVDDDVGQAGEAGLLGTRQCREAEKGVGLPPGLRSEGAGALLGRRDSVGESGRLAPEVNRRVEFGVPCRRYER